MEGVRELRPCLEMLEQKEEDFGCARHDFLCQVESGCCW